MSERVCLICHKEFNFRERKNRNTKEACCSLECKNKLNESKYKNIKCLYCDKEYLVRQSRIKHERYCSEECKNKYRKNLKKQFCENCGSIYYKDYKTRFCTFECYIKTWENYNRKLFRVGAQGYMMIQVNRGNWKYLHRELMEYWLERELIEHEVVHHKDRNKLNNVQSNLVLMKKREHDRLHTTLRHKMRREMAVAK